MSIVLCKGKAGKGREGKGLGMVSCDRAPMSHSMVLGFDADKHKEKNSVC